jgi:hypothetical protein
LRAGQIRVFLKNPVSRQLSALFFQHGVTLLSDVSSGFLVTAGMMKVVHFSRERGRYLGTTSAQTFGHGGFLPFSLPIGLAATTFDAPDHTFLDLVSDFALRDLSSPVMVFTQQLADTEVLDLEEHPVFGKHLEDCTEHEDGSQGESTADTADAQPYTREQIVGHRRRARKSSINTRPKIKANASVESSSMASQVVWLGGVSGHCSERIMVIEVGYPWRRHCKSVHLVE